MSAHATRLVTCPHCEPGQTCCQCAGSRIVASAVAEKNAAWAWEHGGCRCGACTTLRQFRSDHDLGVHHDSTEPRATAAYVAIARDAQSRVDGTGDAARL